MSSDPKFLLVFAVTSLIAVFTLYKFDKQNKMYLIWFTDRRLNGLVFGALGCFIVVFPFLFFYSGIDISNRGGVVNGSLLLPVIIFNVWQSVGRMFVSRICPWYYEKGARPLNQLRAKILLTGSKEKQKI